MEKERRKVIHMALHGGIILGLGLCGIQSEMLIVRGAENMLSDDVQEDKSISYTENGWRIWDEPDPGLGQKEKIDAALKEKAARWKERMEEDVAAAGEETGESIPGQDAAVADNKAESVQQSIQEPEQSANGENSSNEELILVVPDDSREEKAQKSAGEYICSGSDMRYLSEQEVAALSLQAVCYAKNEIYARHGRMFASQELQEYFGEKSWYTGIIKPEDFSDQVFNKYEQANIILLVEREFELAEKGYLLDQAGYDIYNY